MEGADVRRAIAEDGGRHGVVAEHLGGVRRARRDRYARADDRERRKEAHVGRDEMHRASFALEHAGAAAQQLSEHGERREPQRECVSVSAVRACHGVGRAKRRGDADGHGLLALARVHRP